MIRKIIIGIKNFWKYRSIIFIDRDWDYQYFLDLVQFKIVEMRKFHETRANYEGSEDNVLWMKRAEYLLGRLKKDSYCSMKGFGNISAYDMIAKYPKRYYYNRYHFDYMKSQDLKELFNILEKHLFRWWD